MNRLIGLSALIALLLVGALGVLIDDKLLVWPGHGPESTVHFTYSWVINDTSFANDGTASVCGPLPDVSGIPNFPSSACVVPSDQHIRLQELSIQVHGGLVDADDEQCELVVIHSDDPSDTTPEVIAASSIDVGDENANSGKCDDKTINALGEFCKTTFDQTVVANGYYGVRLRPGTNIDPLCGTPPAPTECLCDRMQALRVSLVGTRTYE